MGLFKAGDYVNFLTSQVLAGDRLRYIFCYFKLIVSGTRNRLPNQHIQLARRATASRSHVGLFVLKEHDIVIVLQFCAKSAHDLLL